MTDDIKNHIKDKYSEIALKSLNQSVGCCNSDDKSCYSLMADEYKNIEGYVSEADLGLGCGLPTEYANIKKGNIVVDLGSGAGNDAFIASKLVGDSGRVIGIDFSDEMMKKAQENAVKYNIQNVEFIYDEIEKSHFPIYRLM